MGFSWRRAVRPVSPLCLFFRGGGHRLEQFAFSVCLIKCFHFPFIPLPPPRMPLSVGCFVSCLESPLNNPSHLVTRGNSAGICEEKTPTLLLLLRGLNTKLCELLPG